MCPVLPGGARQGEACLPRRPCAAFLSSSGVGGALLGRVGQGAAVRGASTALRSADLPTADTVTGPVTQFFSPISRFSKRRCFRETLFQKHSSWGLGGRQAPSTSSCR